MQHRSKTTAYVPLWVTLSRILAMIILLATCIPLSTAKADTSLPYPTMLGEYDNFSNPVQMGNFAYFRVQQGPEYSLWRTQGTPQTTERFYVYPDEVTPDYYGPFVYDNKLFFGVNTPYGYQMYASDGTTDGTGFFEDLRGTNYQIYNGWFVFWVKTSTSSQLWKSDGSQSGTVQVNEFDGDLDYRDFPYFRITNSSGDKTLWYTDLTSDGTVMLMQYNFPTSNPLSINNMNIVKTSTAGAIILNRKTIDMDNNELEIWQTENTPDSTQKIATFSNRNGYYFGELDDLAFFVMTNGASDESTYSLWQTDGTESGTVKVADDFEFINAQSGITYDGSFYFLARSSVDEYYYLYRTQGRDSGGIHPIHAYKNTLLATYMSSSFAPYKSKLYYLDRDNGHDTFFYTDGETATMIGYPADDYSESEWLIASQSGYLFFNACSMDDIVHLYISDGTADGTQLYFAPDPSVGANEWPEIALDTPGVIYIRSGTGSPYPSRLWGVTIEQDSSQDKIYLPMIIN